MYHTHCKINLTCYLLVIHTLEYLYVIEIYVNHAGLRCTVLLHDSTYPRQEAGKVGK